MIQQTALLATVDVDLHATVVGTVLITLGLYIATIAIVVHLPHFDNPKLLFHPLAP